MGKQTGQLCIQISLRCGGGITILVPLHPGQADVLQNLCSLWLEQSQSQPSPKYVKYIYIGYHSPHVPPVRSGLFRNGQETLSVGMRYVIY